MDALELITWYQGHNSGLSAYIDGQLQVIRQALHEATWRQDECLFDWSMVGLITAERLSEDLLRVIYVDGEAREFLLKLLSAIVERREDGKNRLTEWDHYRTI